MIGRLTRRELLTAGTALACSYLCPRISRASDPFAFSLAQRSAIGAGSQHAVDTMDVPGVLTLIWRKGRIAYEGAVGLRDIERKTPMDRPTILAIASMSKPVTVALALTLVDEGKMRLDDPITRWAPEFADMRVLRRPDGPLDDTIPAPRAITIEDLMTHRSGLAYGFLAQGPLAGALFEKFGMGIESNLSPDAWMRSLAALPLAFSPGDRFNYGHSIDVLGFIVARALKSTLRTAMQERVIHPLNMLDTDFWIPPEKRDRMAQNYFSPAPGQFVRAEIKSFIGDAPPVYTSGGQGLVSTAYDYLAFARMLLQGGVLNGVRVLRPQSVKLMTTNRLTEEQRRRPSTGIVLGPGQGFGLGVSVVTEPAKYSGWGGPGSFGWGGAFGGWWQTDPEQDMVMLWLQECLPAPPIPGVPLSPRVPGSQGTAEFQKRTYEALRSGNGAES